MNRWRSLVWWETRNNGRAALHRTKDLVHFFVQLSHFASKLFNVLHQFANGSITAVTMMLSLVDLSLNSFSLHS
jgi:hypothetical protein